MVKRINFEKISIENFLSIGNKPVVVDFRQGLHVITGKNIDQSDRRNGIGKSTILDALSYVLFGSTLRELKKEFIINNITKKTSKISLHFSVAENNKINTYELHRTIEPNKCFLYENGIDITRDSMVNTTEFVQSLLKLTPEVFQNCIAMTLNNTVPFMAKKKIEKRKFIESIFNLEIFSEMNTNLKSEMLDFKKEYDIKNGQYNEIKKYFDSLEVQSKNRNEQKNNRKSTLLKRLQDNKTEIDKLTKKISEFQKLNLDSVHEKIKLANDKTEEIAVKINSLGKEISSLETKRDFIHGSMLKIGTDKDACPVCLKAVTAEDKSCIEDKKNNLNAEIKSLEVNIQNLETKLEVYEQSKGKLTDAVYKLTDIVNKQKLQDEQKKHTLSKINDLSSYNKDVVKDIEELNKSDNELEILLNEQRQKLEESYKQLDEYKTDLNILDYVKFVLSEDGVRSYIVKKILQLFNSKLSYYLRKLNSNAFIKFNEFFEDTITNTKGSPVCYFNYSGAEKKVIDLAIMFTFIEMLRLQSNVVYNIQFYDELLDTSLDETGVELVVALLNELSQQYKCGMYVISHRKECSKISNGDVIFLEKKNGITKRIVFDS